MAGYTHAFHEYTSDITQVPRILQRKIAEHDRATAEVVAACARIQALVPRYCALTHGGPTGVDMRALNALVGEHYMELQPARRAQERVDRLEADIEKLRGITSDPEFHRELARVEQLGQVTGDEGARAEAIWESSKESALHLLLSKDLQPGHEVEWSECPPLHHAALRPGTWAMANANHGARQWAMKFYAPVYVLLESHARFPGDEALGGRFFYVWGQWRGDEGVFRTNEEGLLGVPVTHRRG